MMIPNSELALAYELHHDGCTWKRIALGLGVKVGTLKHAIMRIERRGIKENARA